MHFKIILERQGKSDQALLPLNYQYELSAWIYKIIHYGNPVFSEWLHNKGYYDGQKNFKLFTFSGIQSFPYMVKNDRIIFKDRKAHFFITFYLEEAAEPFIIGLFKQQTMGIGDKKTQVDFLITSVERMPDAKIKLLMKFRAISPIVISTHSLQNPEYAQYIGPDHADYTQLLIQNLKAKYNALYSSQKKIQLPEDAIAGISGFKLLSKTKSKLITIKANTPQETKIRGFLFDFEITASAELLELGYKSGFGEKNSLGFGMVEVI